MFRSRSGSHNALITFLIVSLSSAIGALSNSVVVDFGFRKPFSNSGSTLSPGLKFTLEWTETPPLYPEINLELWSIRGDDLLGSWSSVYVPGKSFSENLPTNLKSDKYYIVAHDISNGQYLDETPNFLVQVAPPPPQNPPQVNTTHVTTSASRVITTQNNLANPNTSSSIHQQPTSRTAIVPQNSSASLPAPSKSSPGSNISSVTRGSTSVPVTSHASPSTTSNVSTETPPASIIVVQKSEHTQTGAIIGGTFGGAAFACIVAVCFWIYRRRSRSKSRVTEIGTFAPLVGGPDSPRQIREVQAPSWESSPAWRKTGRTLSHSEQDTDVDGSSPSSNEEPEMMRLRRQMDVMNSRVLSLEEHSRSSLLSDLSPPTYVSDRRDDAPGEDNLPGPNHYIPV